MDIWLYGDKDPVARMSADYRAAGFEALGNLYSDRINSTDVRNLGLELEKEEAKSRIEKIIGE